MTEQQVSPAFTGVTVPSPASPPRFLPFVLPQTKIDLDSLIALVRPHLRRVIAVINGKGGTGKTTIVCNLAVALAEALAESGSEKRVLVIDLDSQGNTALDLGHSQHADNDAGLGLEDSVLRGRPLRVIRNVRPHLDVVPGGAELEQLGTQVITQVTKKGDTAWLGLAVALARIAHEYDYILIDCPPGEANVQRLILNAAAWGLIPAMFDEGSRQGMEKVATRFEEAEKYNPDLDLLGVVLFGFKRQVRTGPDGEVREIGSLARAREWAQAALADTDATVFDTYIRESKTVAEQCRLRGQTVFELGRSSDGAKWWEKRAGRSAGPVLASDRAEQVGEDYEDLAVEVVERIQQSEREAA